MIFWAKCIAGRQIVDEHLAMWEFVWLVEKLVAGMIKGMGVEYTD